jgi:hypothetical protein
MTGMEIKLVVYRTPVKAGSCYVFYNNITRGAPPAMKAKLSANKKPPLETHLSMLRFFVSLKLLCESAGSKARNSCWALASGRRLPSGSARGSGRYLPQITAGGGLRQQLTLPTPRE